MGIPALEDGVKYVGQASAAGIQVLQVSCCRDAAGYVNFSCKSLSGEELCRVTVDENETIMSLPGRISEEIAVGIPEQYLRLVLPNGKLLTSMPGSARVNELLGI